MQRLSVILRYAFSIIFVGAAAYGCFAAFREGDKQTGIILILILSISAGYMLYAWKNKKGFGNLP